MSCDGNRAKFHAHAAKHKGLQDAFGSAREAESALEQIFNLARAKAAMEDAAQVSLAEARTRKLFDEMKSLGLKPSAHSRTGLPRTDALFGYAAVQQTIEEARSGRALPALAAQVKSRNHAPHTPPVESTALMSPITPEEMVAAYERVLGAVEEMRRLANDANDAIQNIFGSSFSVGLRDDRSIEREMLKAVWSSVLNKVGYWKVASLKSAEEKRRQLKTGELPPISVQSLYDALDAMQQNKSDHALESVSEVFEFLCPAQPQKSKLKTMQRSHIGKSAVFKPFEVYDKRYWSMHLHDHGHDKLMAMDRVFHLLDGKVFNYLGYNGPFVDAVNLAMKNPEKKSVVEGETDYFRFKVYGNGNIHIQFLRPDIVAKINAIAGKRQFPSKSEGVK